MRKKIRERWILEKNYRGLVIEKPLNFTDEKLHLMVLSTGQCFMARSISDTMLHMKHHGTHCLIQAKTILAK